MQVFVKFVQIIPIYIIYHLNKIVVFKTVKLRNTKILHNNFHKNNANFARKQFQIAFHVIVQ